jgi:hypothetical protein
LSTGEAASPTNWGDPEVASDFFKADRALRLAREVQASEPARDMPLPLRRPAPEAAPRQQAIAAPAPAQAPSPLFIPYPEPERAMEMPEVRIPYTMPALSVPHNYHVDEVPSHLAEEPGFGQAYNMDDANRLWADPSEEVSRNAYLKKYTLPAPQAEINRAVSLAQNLAPAQPEAIPSATEALAAVKKFQNAGIFSGNEYDKAGEILAAHNRAMFDNIPVEEALRLNRAEGPRMVNQDMPREERPAVQPLAYTAAPTPAPAAAAIDQATGKLTARIPDEPHGTALTKQQADYVIRTIAAETSGKSPEETQAIASVILNRINSGKYGSSPEAVLFAKRQFEPWMNPAGKNYPMKISPTSQRYSDARDALEAAMAGEDITGGAFNFWGPKAQYALGREAPSWGRTGGVDIGETRFHKLERADGGEIHGDEHMNHDDIVAHALHRLRRHFDGSDGSYVDPMGSIAIPAAGPAPEQAPVVMENAERARAAEERARLAADIKAYEASNARIQEQPEWTRAMTHGPEEPRAPVTIDAFGRERVLGHAPYKTAAPLSSLAQFGYGLKTAPLYAAGMAFPPAAALGTAIDTAEGFASGSPTQVAMGAIGGPFKTARNVFGPLAVASGLTAPDEAEAARVPKIGGALSGAARAELSRVAPKAVDPSLEKAFDIVRSATADDAGQAVKTAKQVAGPPQRGILATPDLRQIDRDEAIRVARSEPHLIQDANGQYVGAPRGMTTPEQIQAMREAFDKDVEAGAVGGDWYERAREFNREVSGNDPYRQKLIANEEALWSAQANPDTNLGFGLNARTDYEAGKYGDKYRTGQQARSYE